MAAGSFAHASTTSCRSAGTENLLPVLLPAKLQISGSEFAAAAFG
jgi:hypothetical protein